jgi:hypothetical protein
MRRCIVPIVIATVFMSFSSVCMGRGLGKLVTKANQQELGLEFELSAIREPEAVIVSITIPAKDKLRDLRNVRLSIPAEDERHFLVRAPLEMRKEGDGIRVGAQLAPELAAKTTLDLVVEEGRREFYYAVRVADYITDRGK